MITDPKFAPRRTDLPFLRRRSRPRAAAAAPASASSSVSTPPASSGGAIDYTRRDRTSASTPAGPTSAASASSGSIDYSRPDRRRAGAAAAAPAPAAATAANSGSGSLDLSAPSAGGLDLSRPDREPPAAPPPAAPPPAAPPPASSGGLDLSAPSTTPAPAPSSGGLDLSGPSQPQPAAAAPPSASRPASSSSLDLSAPTAAPSSPPANSNRPPLHAPTPPRARGYRPPRLRAREQFLLGVHNPTVGLTRTQSGIGHLEIEAVCSSQVGDLRIGALYQLRSGGTSIVQNEGASRYAPSSRRPVIVAGHDEYERISIDLRQVRDVERIAIYAFSQSRTPLTWGGTLVLTTFGGARVELPLESLYSGAIAVLLSIYSVDGELVIRAERETVTGDVREAARAYGYDRITWRDERTPVD